MARDGWRCAIVGAVVVALAGCTGGAPAPTPQASAASAPAPRPTAASAPSSRASAGSDARAPLRPAAAPTVLARGLDAPWSVVRLRSGSALISERDSGVIKELTAGGAVRTAGRVAGVAPAGEGGLLGLAAWYEDSTTWIYAYYTSASDNRIVRMPLNGHPGDYSLGPQHDILTGLAKAANHDGGRIAIGPDRHLYATVGDAGVLALAQDRKSLNGKILRMNLDGSVPPDNPFPGSPVYSLGHRNPEGLAWDASGQLWAAEFGQDTWDEFNRILPGGNYGWPDVEGIGHKPGFVDPVYQWPVADASPSGLAFVGGTFFLAALRGRRLWAIHPGARGTTATAAAYFTGDYGRLRDAVPGPDGTLWVLTNNTDGRGNPQPGDDRLLQIQLDRPTGD